MSRVFKTKDGSFVFVSNNAEVSTLSQSGGFSMKEISLLSGGTAGAQKIVYDSGNTRIDINNSKLLIADSGAVSAPTSFTSPIVGGTRMGNTVAVPLMYLDSNSLSFQPTVDADTDSYLNWTGYNGGGTRKRGLIIGNGTGVECIKITGATGAVTVPVNITLGNASQNQKQVIYSSSVSILAFEHSASLYNWCIRTNETVASAFQIFPSTAAGGTTYSTPALTITPAGQMSVPTGGITIGNSTNGLGTNQIISNQAGSDVLIIRNYYSGASASYGVSVCAGNTASDRCMQWTKSDGATTIGSVGGTGAWMLGPNSGTFALTHTINTTSGTTGGYLSINATGNIANGQSNRILVTDNNTERATLGVFKSVSLTGSAGYLALTEDNVGLYYLWIKSGKLYISNNAANIGTATGTVVGTQT